MDEHRARALDGKLVFLHHKKGIASETLDASANGQNNFFLIQKLMCLGKIDSVFIGWDSSPAVYLLHVEVEAEVD